MVRGVGMTPWKVVKPQDATPPAHRYGQPLAGLSSTPLPCWPVGGVSVDHPLVVKSGFRDPPGGPDYSEVARRLRGVRLVVGVSSFSPVNQTRPMLNAAAGVPQSDRTSKGGGV